VCALLRHFVNMTQQNLLQHNRYELLGVLGRGPLLRRNLLHRVLEALRNPSRIQPPVETDPPISLCLNIR
jgi:hypothetical protein